MFLEAIFANLVWLPTSSNLAIICPTWCTFWRPPKKMWKNRAFYSGKSTLCGTIKGPPAKTKGSDHSVIDLRYTKSLTDRLMPQHLRRGRISRTAQAWAFDVCRFGFCFMEMTWGAVGIFPLVTGQCGTSIAYGLLLIWVRKCSVSRPLFCHGAGAIEICSCQLPSHPLCAVHPGSVVCPAPA